MPAYLRFAEIVLLLTLSGSLSLKEKEKIPGHLQKLGSHKEPMGVTMIGKFSTPAVFYQHFVKPGKPLWMRSVLNSLDHPGLTNWTDSYLSKMYGSETIRVETNKKENRNFKPTWMTLHQFLSLYKTEDVYMVHTLQNKMAELVLVPSSLQCGGFHKALLEAVMWMGSSSTMSLLHSDQLDNLLCLLDGRKDFVLIDKVYKPNVESHGFISSSGHSLVDVARVDLIKFPQFANIPWHVVHLDKGDCLFIPNGWYHQVTSNSNRHVAINIWFSHLFWFNQGNCSNHKDFYNPLEPISTFGFASPNELYRSKLIEQLHNKGILLKEVFVSSLSSSSEERRNQFFDAIDRFKDSVLSWSELYGFDIDKAILKFPDIFDLPCSSLIQQREVIELYETVPVLPDLEVKDFSEVSPEDFSHSVQHMQVSDTYLAKTGDDSFPALEKDQQGHTNLYKANLDDNVKEDSHNFYQPKNLYSNLENKYGGEDPKNVKGKKKEEL